MFEIAIEIARFAVIYGEEGGVEIYDLYDRHIYLLISDYCITNCFYSHG